MRISHRRLGDDPPVTLDELICRVEVRLTGQQRALLIGAPPPISTQYNYVNLPPYDAVVLGLLPPGLVFHQPDETVCRALLDGLPVYLYQPQPYHRAAHGVLLRQKLRQAEERLLLLGVRPLKKGFERDMA